MTNSLRVSDSLPEGFLSVGAKDLVSIVPAPTLFDLPGRRNPPLFVSVLLHGNEDTGLLAIQSVLRNHLDRPLPRRLLLFVGNVEAASAGVRTLDTQLDFNRAWPGTLHPDAPESQLMQDVLDHIAKISPFASVDIHNNTGLNPHYACLNRLDDSYLHLARLFSRTVVYFERPVGVQSAAMASLCPAVTVECGRAGDTSATEHSAEFIEACLSLTEFPSHPPQPADFDLLRTFAVVKVPSQASFSFDGSRADFQFREDIDHFNFSEVTAGTAFGRTSPSSDLLLDVETDEPGAHPNYFVYENDKIVLARDAVPAMLTRDVNAVRLDCLCYLMHRIDFSGRRVGV